MSSIPNLGPMLDTMLAGIRAQMNVMTKVLSKIDWKKLRKTIHENMKKEVIGLKDERLTGIVSHTLAEYWLNQIIARIFSNHKEIQQLSFSTKRQVLHGLGLINPNYNNDLKKLNDIRIEYAHSFATDKEKISKSLEKMNCYKKINFPKNAKK